MISDLQQFLNVLRAEKEIAEIKAVVDPNLEAAEIHRRVIAEGGPALLFTNIKGASFPLVTNLFGTQRRVELAFGPRPERLVQAIASLPETLLPPSPRKLWSQRSTLWDLLRVGLKQRNSAPVKQIVETEPRLMRLPLLKTWERDGGPFITLPLIYTEHPRTHISNLGIYRCQRFDDSSTGFHCQIGKGGGFHLVEAKRLGQRLPVNIHIGGAPAFIMAGAAPLPENVPELLLASLIMNGKVHMSRSPLSPIPFIADAEFVLLGEVDPNEMRPEGPFGDHYGYYSLEHDYPVFRCKALLRRKNAVCTATVVGKGRQEDCFMGDYLQTLLAPVFPLVMPNVVDLWAYGETGYHSLAAAVVKQRYKREALASAFRIMGEGQLSLTKFLLVVEKRQNLKDFRSVLEYVLERADFRTDLYVFSNTSMDTLDYTSTKVNEGSKGTLLGLGEPIRKLPGEFSGAQIGGVRNILPFCRGCLLVDGPAFKENSTFAERLAKEPALADWPLIVLVDDARKTVSSVSSFLWTTFTRFEPASDIHARSKQIIKNHIAFEGPVVIDSRMKPGYPDELECDEATSKIVSKRWGEYFYR